MKVVIPLGTFEQVPLREAWPSEDENFTPWLAQAEIIPLLGKALNLELEVETVEHSVGPFRADILAHAIDETDHRVIIENQLERTDHSHLGQILTYLAGTEGAKTVVWIAETIQPDHRAAIDWLNANTPEEFSFFAIEIELWRIDGSPPAPRFNVIASPNPWTKPHRPDTEDNRIRSTYWASFAEFLRTKHDPIFSIARPPKGGLCRFPFVHPNVFIVASVMVKPPVVWVGLAMPTFPYYAALLSQKDAIQAEFSERLQWYERRVAGPPPRALIAVSRQSVDLADQTKYQDLHVWMFDRMERFQVVFAPCLKSLPQDNDEAENTEE